MAGRLGPLVFVLVLAGLYAVGDRLENYSLNRTIGCAYDLARLDRPAPDLLFWGNSRAGAAIDPVYIERRINHRRAEGVRVERLAMTSPDTTAANVWARTYLRHRGAPEVIVLQLMYERDLDDVNRLGLPVHKPRSIAFGELGDLYRVQADAELSPAEHGLPPQLLPGYRSFIGVMLDKAVTNIYSVLESPKRSILGKARRCVDDEALGQSIIWMYDEDWPMTGPVHPRSASESSAGIWAANVAKYVPIDPADPVRQFENHQLHEFIRLFEQRGSKVLLMQLPTFGQPIADEGGEALVREFSGNPIVDVHGHFRRVSAGSESGYFRDQDHVNAEGAILISRYLADTLAGTLD